MTTLRKVLDSIAVANLYVLVFCILFLIQEYTIGQIPWLRSLTLFNKVYTHDILFLATSIVIIVRYIRVYPPEH